VVIVLSFSYSRAWALRPQSRLLGDLFSEKSEHRFTIPVEKWLPHFEMRVPQGRNATFPLFFALVLGIAHIQGLASFLVPTSANVPSTFDACIARYLAAGDTLRSSTP
jgi:hypothetical protein